jgi:hypothetical protein
MADGCLYAGLHRLLRAGSKPRTTTRPWGSQCQQLRLTSASEWPCCTVALGANLHSLNCF